MVSVCNGLRDIAININLMVQLDEKTWDYLVLYIELGENTYLWWSCRKDTTMRSVLLTNFFATTL